MKVALYGKGGIGKSTVASNISACCALSGMKVLQIGCDPKHDSTILLSGGCFNTVLEQLNSEFCITATDIVHSGKFGIDCIEIGGPTPGVGCAGRGIIRGIEVIEQSGVLSFDYDLIIYDILGDVVCGGFFEPVKNKKVDVMYVVTSGEFNSLYAANNLCAGYINCGLKEKGVDFGGIIANLRGIQNEQCIISEFCKLLNVNLVSIIPRDERIENGTFTGRPVIEAYPDSNISEIYVNLARAIRDGYYSPTCPTPLSLEELRSLILRLK